MTSIAERWQLPTLQRELRTQYPLFDNARALANVLSVIQPRISPAGLRTLARVTRALAIALDQLVDTEVNVLVAPQLRSLMLVAQRLRDLSLGFKRFNQLSTGTNVVRLDGLAQNWLLKFDQYGTARAAAVGGATTPSFDTTRAGLDLMFGLSVTKA